MFKRKQLFFMLEDAWLQILSARERWDYWLPVFIACGIGSYFLLSFEPPLIFLALSLALGLTASWQTRRHEVWKYPSLALTMMLLGFFCAGVRTNLVETRMLDRATGPILIEGSVEESEQRVGGYRFVLYDIRYEKPASSPALSRIRLSMQAKLMPEQPKPGQRLRILASLLPITEPAAPGAYNFRRQLYFEGIGATGMVLRAPEILADSTHSASLAEYWRNEAANRIRAVISGSEGAIAVALMTGERGAIDDKTNEDMRKAGTAHMLSISGMHIGMVGGFIFFLVRLLFAAFPRVALHYPIKKAAALVALVSVVAYTWLVGAPIPAQRAMLMTGLVFVAVALDRQALSMRSVALAATFILILFPESLLNPGFQMSFAAIVMLIAAYEWWQRRRIKEKQRNTWLQRSWLYIAGIVVTSVIAGFATMPYGAWHFHRLQLLGVIGNLIAVPLTGFIIMPMAVLAYAVLPFGFEGPVLGVMGWGLRGVTQSAAWVASLPGADLNVAQFGLAPLVLMTVGGLWLAIWQTKIRMAGLGLVLLGIFMVPFYRQPVALISSEGQVAVRGADGHLYYQRPPRGLIARDWSRAYDHGHEGQSWSANPASGVQCDALGCVAPGGLALIKHMEALEEDCRRATYVVVPASRVRTACAAHVIDKQALREKGSHALYANGTLQTVRSGSYRPWQPYYQTDRRAALNNGAASQRDVPAP